MSDRIVLVIIIAGALALSGWLGHLWQQAVKDFAEYRGKAEQAAKDAEQRVKEIEAHYQEVVKNVSAAWDASLPGVRETAIENYVRRFGTAARLCPGGAVGLQPQPALPAGEPGAAPAAGVPVREESQQLASGEAAFVAGCAEDAAARNSTRELMLRLGFKPEGAP